MKSAFWERKVFDLLGIHAVRTWCSNCCWQAVRLCTGLIRDIRLLLFADIGIPVFYVVTWIHNAKFLSIGPLLA